MKAQKNDNTSNISLSLPHNEEAEKATIGALLLEKSAVYEIMDFLKPEMFYNKSLKEVYSAILSVESHSGVDLITVTNELQKENKEFDLYRLATLSDEVSSASHIKYHAMMVYDEFLRRQFIIRCAQALNDSNDKSVDVSDLINNHVFEVENLTNISEVTQTTSISKIAAEAMRGYQERAKKAEKGESSGIHTGLKRLDRATHGFQKGCVYILAARPGMGKTAFMLNITRKTAKQGNAVLIFSLEMTKRSLIDRMVIAESGVNGSDYKAGRLIPDEVYSMGTALENLSLLPIHVNDTASISLKQIKAQAKKLKRKGKCDLILIDYLQLIDMQSFSGKSKNDEVAACSRAVKVMAKDLDVPVVLLSQLNRGVEGRSNKIPMLSDLRDSGSIEQDADAVLFIHRESYYVKDAKPNQGIIRIAKNREEAPGDVVFWVSDDVTNFKDID
jgi:replicative DNA helicase